MTIQTGLNIVGLHDCISTFLGWSNRKSIIVNEGGEYSIVQAGGFFCAIEKL
jgi:hypothetical protein